MTRKHPNSCRSLIRRLNGMTEDEVKQQLLAEINGERRVTIVERLHQRFTSLRAARERLELMTEVQRERQAAQPVSSPQP